MDYIELDSPESEELTRQDVLEDCSTDTKTKANFKSAKKLTTNIEDDDEIILDYENDFDSDVEAVEPTSQETIKLDSSENCEEAIEHMATQPSAAVSHNTGSRDTTTNITTASTTKIEDNSDIKDEVAATTETILFRMIDLSFLEEKPEKKEPDECKEVKVIKEEVEDQDIECLDISLSSDTVPESEGARILDDKS